PDADARAGLEAVMASGPGLILVTEDADVVVATGGLDEVTPGPPPVVLVGESAWSLAALRSGVRALIPPDAPSGEIVAAVYAAANGLAAVDPRELEGWLGPLPRDTAQDAGPLTPREREVLAMMAEGAANKIIAWKLGISEHTAKFHVASILGKLNAGTRAEAVAVGIKRGLILL